MTILEKHGIEITDRTINNMMRHGDAHFAVREIAEMCAVAILDRVQQDPVMVLAYQSLETKMNELLTMITEKIEAGKNITVHELKKYRGYLTEKHSMSLVRSK